MVGFNLSLHHSECVEIVSLCKKVSLTLHIVKFESFTALHCFVFGAGEEGSVPHPTLCTARLPEPPAGHD